MAICGFRGSHLITEIRFISSHFSLGKKANKHILEDVVFHHTDTLFLLSPHVLLVPTPSPLIPL